MTTGDAVIDFGLTLPRSSVAIVRDRRKLRVGRLVYVALSRDESIMGFGFPKEERSALVGGEPGKFMLPAQGDMRFNWVLAKLAALDPAEARELVVDAWRMCVPKKLSRAYDEAHPDGPG